MLHGIRHINKPLAVNPNWREPESQLCVKETDMNTETRNAIDKPFRYTLWDLLALTTHIAVLLGLPHETLGFLVAASIASAILLAFPAVSGLVFARINDRVVSRTIFEITARVFLFLIATIAVGTFSLTMRQV